MRLRTGQPHRDRDYGPGPTKDALQFSVTDDQRDLHREGEARGSGAVGSNELDAYSDPKDAFNTFNAAYEAHGVHEWLRKLGV